MCSIYIALSLSAAPPLTADTLFTLVKEVKSWRRLAKSLIRAYNQDAIENSTVTFIGGSTDLDALERQHSSDEECLKAVIEMFFEGKGSRLDQQPLSWRVIIWALYEANEVQLASNIKSHAEPLQGVQLRYYSH